jgi:dTDP-4-amino-4,6-dideoxygalactose transaminase
MVAEAVASGWVAPTGPMVDAFEEQVAARCGRRYAVALSSGTAALHLALLAAGAGPGTVVLVPTLTFAATANAVVYTGAQPVFVDCDPRTGVVDPDLVAQTLAELAREGTVVAALVPVDLLGRAADQSRLGPICERAGVPVVTDSAESLGARHGDRPAASYGVSAVLSFNGNKIMTTSGGGMLLTDDAAAADRARYLGAQARRPAVHYEHTEVGYNYRLSNVLAALGLAQLERLDAMVARRRALRGRYADAVAGMPGVEVFQRAGDEADNCWLTALLVDPVQAGWTAADLHRELDARGIESRPLWKPMHRQPVFAGCRAVLDGSADALFATGLALPSGSALQEPEIDRVLTALASFEDR